MSLAEFHAALRAQGRSSLRLLFRCPMCATVQCADDLIAAGAGKDFDAIGGFLAFSCVGRWTRAGSPPSSGDSGGKGCNWTLGGLLRTHKLEIVTEDGKHHPRFEPLTPEECGAHDLAKVAR